CCHEQCERYRKIERRASLNRVTRREVNGDPPWRHLQSRIGHSSTYAFPALLDGSVRHSHDVPERQPSGDVHLHRHLIGIDAKYGRAADGCEHGGILVIARHGGGTVVIRAVPTSRCTSFPRTAVHSRSVRPVAKQPTAARAESHDGSTSDRP